MYPNYEKLAQRGKEFLGVEHPIMCGAMTWISNSALVSAISKSGGFGLLAGGNLSPEDLEKEIIKTRELTDGTFGVNLITIAPNYRDHLKLACDMGASYIAFAAVFPDAKAIAQAKDAGAKTICFAPAASVAKRMIKLGIDALIIEGFEAGGHIGPVSTTVLLQDVLFKVRDEVPVFVAGGIATGKMIAHMMLMGAAGVQLGTRFIMAEECQVHPDFKDAFRKAKSRDAITSPTIDPRLPIIPVRALKNRGTDNFVQLQLDLIKQLGDESMTRRDAQEEVEKFWVGALRNAAQDGDLEHGSMMAGQCVGLVNEVMPMQAIFDELLEDTEAELAMVANRLNN